MLFLGGDNLPYRVFSRYSRIVFLASLDLNLLFHAITFAFYNDGVGVMEEPVKDGGGECCVIVENFRPMFVCPV